MSKPLSVQELIKDYGPNRAVDKVSFEVEPGEIFGLLGPNGAGKTSIISIITTLERPTGGAVSVFGHDVVKDSRQAKVNLGVVPQEIINHGYFTVEEILKFHSGYFGIWENQKQIDFLLERLDLHVHRNKRVKQLSGGMKRRLLIAKALVHKPKLLLLDEPTAGVDIELRESLWGFVEELKAQGISVVLTTHYLEEAEQLCDRVGIIHKGQIRKVGPTSSLIKEFTQRRIQLTLKDQIAPVSHRWLVDQSANQLVFQVPADQGLGDLMSTVDFSYENVMDAQIMEGTLEDAFRRVLGEPTA
ncbi:MAG: ATPase [Bdellovibrionaceae bacterium]|nr:ATPase [Pseudobdellovibrionaceae bacterium]